GNKTRRIPVYATAVRWLESYLALRRKKDGLLTDRMFVTPSGSPITRQTIHTFIKEYAERCGFTGVSPHTLRHSFATHLVQNNASTTQIYTHVTSEQLKRNYERFHPRSGGLKSK
ncbi:MAG: tyrosine-type recombinase/integrase, partial [Blastocatellia bacterium]|nr:tyrosine-type recombinase/integrase [Blastocatellia bacterium]